MIRDGTNTYIPEKDETVAMLNKLAVGMRVRIGNSAPYSIHILSEYDDRLASKLSPEAAAIHTVSEVAGDYFVARFDYGTSAGERTIPYHSIAEITRRHAPSAVSSPHAERPSRLPSEVDFGVVVASKPFRRN